MSGEQGSLTPLTFLAFVFFLFDHFNKKIVDCRAIVESLGFGSGCKGAIWSRI